MKTDFSRVIYDKYFQLENRNVIFVLKNGRIIKGFIVGFFKGNEYNNEPYIVKWQVAEENITQGSIVDAFGYIKGEIIEQKNISEVHFIVKEKISKIVLNRKF